MIGIDAVQQNMLVDNYALALRARARQRHGPDDLARQQPAVELLEDVSRRTSPCPTAGHLHLQPALAQLKMVAQIIEAGYRSAASGGLGMKRQVFFVQVGGYDLHTGQTSQRGQHDVTNNAKVILGAQANLFAELSQSLNAFQNAMIQIGVQNGDANFDQPRHRLHGERFGRTFPSNSLGSDHGWGSHHLVMGGAVQAARTRTATSRPWWSAARMTPAPDGGFRRRRWISSPATTGQVVHDG